MNNHRLLQLVLRCMTILVFFTLSSCSAGRPPAVTETPTAVPPTETASPTATPQPTATSTPTLTPTPTATATITPTPEPSPTPLGFYRNSGAGYSLTYPTGWEIIGEVSGQLIVGDLSGNIMMFAYAQSEKEATDLETSIKQVGAGLKKGDTLQKAGDFEKMELADGVEATKAPLILTQNGQKLDLWMFYTHKGNRGYTIIFMGPAGSLQSRGSTIRPILQSLRLFEPQPYDLPRDQTLTMLGGDPLGENIDPATAKGSAGNYTGMLFSGLVRLDTNLQVVPDLAESWKISTDGKVYTFVLRPGLKFSNGDPITADDVRKSWERACDPKIKSTTAATYLNDILGASDYISGNTKEIQGLKVVDERTLEVTLDEPKAYFLAKLTYPTTFVIDTRQPEERGINWMFEPNSSGPYTVKEYKKNEALILEKNPNYHQPAGVSYLLFFFEPGGSALSLYEEGVIDMLSLSYSQIAEISKPDHELNKQMVSVTTMCTNYLQLNTNLAPTDDPLVRKALFLGVDRKAYIDKLSNNVPLLANGVLPPAMPGYLAERQLPEFDPKAAKDALKESKYAGKALTITISASGYGDTQRQDVAFLVDQWKKNLGVNVKVELTDPDIYVETIRQKPGNIVIQGWCADYPDPENFLDVLFHSGNTFNYTNLNDAELDALLEKARTELDSAKRISLYQQAESYLLDQYAVIPLTNYIEGMLVKPRVKNFILTPIDTKILADLVLEKE